MRDTKVYAQILGVRSPWEVTGVSLDLRGGEVEVFVGHGSPPECGSAARRYDSRPRRWRHLPTCQYRTILVVDVPRVRCSEHGVNTVPVPWSDPRSGFTALFETLIIDWLREASILARRLALTGTRWME